MTFHGYSTRTPHRVQIILFNDYIIFQCGSILSSQPFLSQEAFALSPGWFVLDPVNEARPHNIFC